GDPAAYQTMDAGIVSYGRHQATLQSGTLHSVLQAYFRRSGSETSRALQQEFAARVEQRDAGLRHDARLKELLLAAAVEPEMGAAQDEVFDRQFFQPAVAQARQRSLRTPLGVACLYDTQIQGGLFILLPRADARAGGSVGDAGGVSEASWLAAFLDEREARLLALADQAEARGDSASARALRVSTFRVTEYRTLLAANNLWLEGELLIRGRRVAGLTFGT
ncbi:MAG: chitosanase, partial [Anaerolineales bacterium]|nr:chitosanase [Anaerolineales bacterium]